MTADTTRILVVADRVELPPEPLLGSRGPVSSGYRLVDGAQGST